MNQTNLLPSKRDFDPYQGCLDAQWAWKNFGGLDLDEAKAKFAENPLHYQEDFMWMGGRAFAYYFPVIEDYLKTVSDEVYHWDHGAWILANCIEMQFEVKDVSSVRHLAHRVIELANYVRENIARFSPYGIEVEGQRVIEAWNELAELVQSQIEDQVGKRFKKK